MGLLDRDYMKGGFWHRRNADEVDARKREAGNGRRMQRDRETERRDFRNSTSKKWWEIPTMPKKHSRGRQRLKRSGIAIGSLIVVVGIFPAFQLVSGGVCLWNWWGGQIFDIDNMTQLKMVLDLAWDQTYCR